MIQQNIKEFHISINNEIVSLKDRIRHLIAGTHWATDGTYKESVLRAVLRRYLPEEYNIGQGFIVFDDNTVSKQIDILITDKKYPHLFKDGDSYIVTQDAARAIIEVKTTLNASNLKDATKKLFNDVNKINTIRDNINSNLNNIWAGLFAYDINIDNISDKLIFLQDYPHIDCISLGQSDFIHYWRKTSTQIQDEYSYYEFRDCNFSFSYFIGNLIDYLSDYKANQNAKFWYPLTQDGGKEVYKKESIIISTISH